MPDAKRPDPKRRSPASRPAKPGDSVRRGRSAKSSRPAQTATARNTTRTTAEHVVEPIKRQIAESVEQRADQRLGFTARRAAVLAAVICVLTLTIAGPGAHLLRPAHRDVSVDCHRSRAASSDRRPRAEEGQAGRPGLHRGASPRAAGFCETRRYSIPSSAAVGGGGRPRSREAIRPNLPTTILGTRRCGIPSPTSRTCHRPAWPPRRPNPGPRVRCRRYRRTPRLPVVDRADLEAVERQLGREPRGVLEIAYRCPNGEPGVVRPRRNFLTARRFRRCIT